MRGRGGRGNRGFWVSLCDDVAFLPFGFFLLGFGLAG